MNRGNIPIESLIILHNNLSGLSARHPDRRRLLEETAKSFDISLSTIRRALRNYCKPRSSKRTDFNRPRNLGAQEMQYYCELIAALKIRTTNKKGRHLSTTRALWILENHGAEIEGKKIIVSKGLLKKSTVNRYLKRLGLGSKSLWAEPVVTHFQAENSNDCWQLDFTSSELKKIPDDDAAEAKLLIASVVDDRSGVTYQEYFASDGENALMALRFLFNAMAEKPQKDFPFQGIPKMLYMDNGPVAKSLVFRRTCEQLGIQIMTHLPQGSDGRRTTARSKGKVERPFRTIQDSFEVLYHFHKPKNIQEANTWLWNYLQSYNAMPHRTEPHSRLEDWKKNLGTEGYRKMCSWERFSQITREPCERKVGSDACVNIDGVQYQLKSEMAGEIVTVLLGVFDNEVYVEFRDKKEGPFYPTTGPIPLHTYRAHKKTNQEKHLDKVHMIAKQVTLPRSVLTNNQADEAIRLITEANLCEAEPLLFVPFKEIKTNIYFQNSLEAKLAISAYLGRPLATLHAAQLQQIEDFIKQTMNKEMLLSMVSNYFQLRLVKGG